jgi:hypothetical protein
MNDFVTGTLLIVAWLLSSVIVGAVAYKTGRLDEKLEREWNGD